MEADDLVRRLHAAAAGDRVLQQEIAMSMAVERELQRNARVHCAAVVDQYLAEKRAAASEGSAEDAHDHERAYEQASSMMKDFLSERAELWSAQMRALLQVSALRQEQRLRLKQLQEFTITIPLEQQQQQPPKDPRCRGHQQQQPPQDSEQQHEPGSASASAAPQKTASTNLATPKGKGKGSAAIRRERARLAEELGIKPKGTLNRQRRDCKKRRDLKYKEAAAAAAQQRHWQRPR